MRIPITITGPEDRSSRKEPGQPLRRHPRYRDSHGNLVDDEGIGLTGPVVRGPTNLAVEQEPEREREVNAPYDEPPVESEPAPEPTRHVKPDQEPKEDWKERYLRLRADFDNYKRHAEAERDRLSGMGREKVLEDIFPVVEHMERAIRAAKDARDRTGILEGIELVYQELLKVLEKNGVERIRTVGTAFDPEFHDALAVSDHADYPAGTVVEEVRAGFRKDGKLLRPASVIVAR